MRIEIKNPAHLAAVILEHGEVWGVHGTRFWIDNEAEFNPFMCGDESLNGCWDTKVVLTEEPFNPKTCPDKAIVLCWDSNYTCCRVFRFWDSMNEMTFDNDGEREGAYYQNYKLIEDKDAPFMVELRKYLED